MTFLTLYHGVVSIAILGSVLGIFVFGEELLAVALLFEQAGAFLLLLGQVELLVAGVGRGAVCVKRELLIAHM